MKKHMVLVPFLVTLALSGNAPAQQKMEGMKGMDMKSMDMKGMDTKGMDMGKKSDPGAQATHQAVGVVKKLDAKAGSVSIAHGPVPSMNWPAMTMTFKVQSPDMLKELAVGQKVQAAFIENGSDFVITKLTK